MTKFLASVSTRKEAEIALAANADIIDLKDPRQGALGAVSDECVREILDLVEGRKPVSATIGDLPLEPKLICKAVEQRAKLGLDFIKIGFPDDPNRKSCIQALNQFAKRGVSIVAVFFADQPFDPELITLAKSAALAGVMFDTAEKNSGSLTNCRSTSELKAFTSTAHHHGLFTGLAGSLKADNIPELLALSPDYLGFRGALCEHAERNSPLSLQACQNIRARLPSPQQTSLLSREAPNFMAHL